MRKIINNRENPMMEESVLFNYWVVEVICGMGYVTEGIEAVLKQSTLKQIGAKHVQINEEQPVLLSGLKEDLVLKEGDYTIIFSE